LSRLSINRQQVMHENREISSAPWSDDRGRSAKAPSRTADMHVLERSDCAVVPVNQPNKEGRFSAEAGEGRTQTISRRFYVPIEPRRIESFEVAICDLKTWPRRASLSAICIYRTRALPGL